MHTTDPVLVVEDDHAIAALVRATLVDEGYDVVSAATAEEALRVLNETRVSLILLDVLLGDVDGRAVVEEYLRTCEEHAPIAVMTALVDDQDWPDAVVTHLRKPFDIDDLLAVVRRYTA